VPTILFAKDQPAVVKMVDSGADVLSIASCVDLGETARRFGHRVGFQGNVDNRILHSGSLEEIDEAVRACVLAGRHKGHILNLGHGILKDTPFENVCRFIETAKKVRALVGS
jgi:uroporphyrinogen decarboxylase